MVNPDNSPEFDADSPFKTSEKYAGVFLESPKSGSFHLGILFKTTDSDENCIHLCWENALSTRKSKGKILWVAPAFDKARLRQVGAVCRRIWGRFEKSQIFPYSLHFLGAKFDKTGDLFLEKGTSGLTCSTFVTSVFATCEMELVKIDSWPVRQEESKGFLKAIEGFPNQNGVIDKIKNEVMAGAIRIKPQEVMAACTSPTFPVSFQFANEGSSEIEKRFE